MSAGKHRRGSNTDLHIPKVDRMSSPRQQDNQTKCSSINKTSQKDEMMDLPSSNMPNHAQSAGDMTDNNIRHCVTVEEVQDEDDIPELHHNNDDNKNDECYDSSFPLLFSLAFVLHVLLMPFLHMTITIS